MPRRTSLSVATLCLFASLAPASHAQSRARAVLDGDTPFVDHRPAADSGSRLVRFTGQLPVATTQPSAAAGLSRNVTFAIYAQAEGGQPVWSESQTVSLDATGSYTALLGATFMNGVPATVFTSGEPRWLGVAVEGESEQARMLLVSVPYAVSAENSSQLGGKPAADYVTRDELQSTVQTATALASQPAGGSARQPGGLDDTANGARSVTQQGLTGAGASSFSDTSGNEVVFVNQSGTGMGLNAATTGTVAVNGTNSSGTGTAVNGNASSATGTAVGVNGTSAAPNGQGVVGSATSTSTNSTDTPTGVKGSAAAAFGTGVSGSASGTSGTGVHGVAAAASGNGIGVLGEAVSPAGTAGLFNVSQTNATILSGTVNGAAKFTVAGNGIVTATKFVGDGSGLTNLPVQQGNGVFSFNNTTQAVSITQTGTGTALVVNTTTGGLLMSGQSSGNEVFRLDGSPTAPQTLVATNSTALGGNSTPNNPLPAALMGHSTATTGSTAGVVGVADGSQSYGLLGINFSTSGSPGTKGAAGILGVTLNPAGTGMGGLADDPNGNTVGVGAHVASPNGTALHLTNQGAGMLIRGDVDGQTQVFGVSGQGVVTATKFIGDGSGLTNLNFTPPAVLSLGFPGGAAGQSEMLLEFSSPGSSGQSLFNVGEIRAQTNGVDSTGSILSIDPINSNGTGFATGLVLKSGGNVGIGTTNPGQKLEVAGAIVATGSSIANRTGVMIFDNGAGQVGAFTAPNNPRQLNVSGGPLTFSTPNAGGTYVEQARIQNSTGNFGIGTTTPSQKLDVAGNIKASGTVTAAQFIGDGSLLTGITASNASTLGGVPAANFPQLNQNNAFAAAVNTFSGNLGIGTTTPAAPLDIQASGNSALIDLHTFRNTNGQSELAGYFSRGTALSPTAAAQNDRLLQFSALGNSVPTGQGYASSSDILFDVDGPVSVGIVPGRISFQTADSSGNDTERMRITSSGNVGIGTSSPNSLLDVAGNAHVSGALTAGSISAPNIVSTSSSNSFTAPQTITGSANQPELTVQGSNGQTADLQQWKTASGALAAEFNSSLVGGTNQTLLSLNSQTSADEALFTAYDNPNQANAAYFAAGIGGGSTSFPNQAVIGSLVNGSGTLHPLNIIVGGGSAGPPQSAIFIDTNRFVGIGTTTPAAPLDVTGAASVRPFGGSDTREIDLTTPGATDGGITMRGSSNDLVNRIDIARVGGDILFYTGNQPSPETMHLTATRRVGIGTSTPAFPLDVNGTVNATAFKGDGSQLTGITANGNSGDVANTLVLRDGNGDFIAHSITAQGNLNISGQINGSGAGLTNIPNSATNANSSAVANTIVSRDANGDFSAHTITTQGNLNVSGQISGSGAGLTNIPNTGTSANSAAVANTIVSRDANGDFVAHTVTAQGNLNVNGQISGSGAGLTGIPNNGTTANSSDVANTIVSRDANGDFVAHSITAEGNLTVNGSISGAGVVSLASPNTFTAAQQIFGSADQTQLTVKGNSAQTADLQDWVRADGTQAGRLLASSSANTTRLDLTANGTLGEAFMTFYDRSNGVDNTYLILGTVGNTGSGSGHANESFIGSSFNGELSPRPLNITMGRDNEGLPVSAEYFDTNGHVGIYNRHPQYPLDVTGNANVSGTLTATNVTVSGTITAPNLVSPGSPNTFTVPQSVTTSSAEPALNITQNDTGAGISVLTSGGLLLDGTVGGAESVKLGAGWLAMQGDSDNARDFQGNSPFSLVTLRDITTDYENTALDISEPSPGGWGIHVLTTTDCDSNCTGGSTAVFGLAQSLLGIGISGEADGAEGVAGLFNATDPGGLILKGLQAGASTVFSVDFNGNVRANAYFDLNGTPIGGGILGGDGSPGNNTFFGVQVFTNGGGSNPIATFNSVDESDSGHPLLIDARVEGNSHFTVGGNIDGGGPFVTASNYSKSPRAITMEVTNQDADQGIALLAEGNTISRTAILAIADGGGTALEATSGTGTAITATNSSPAAASILLTSNYDTNGTPGDLVQGTNVPFAGGVAGTPVQVFRVDGFGNVLAESFTDAHGLLASTGTTSSHADHTWWGNQTVNGAQTVNGDVQIASGSTLKIGSDPAFSSAPRLTWTTFISATGITSPPVVAGLLVPDANIVVTRVSAAFVAGTGCTTGPTLQLADDNHASDNSLVYNLTIADQSSGMIDGGAIAAGFFPGGAAVKLKITAADDCSGQHLRNLNVTVQYRMAGPADVP